MHQTDFVPLGIHEVAVAVRTAMSEGVAHGSEPGHPDAIGILVEREQTGDAAHEKDA